MIRISRAATTLQILVAMCISLALSSCDGAAADPSTGSATAQSATSTATPTATESAQALGQQGSRWLDCWRQACGVEFSAARYSATQSAGFASLTVIRTGAASAAIQVSYATVNGTAIAGTDYTTTSGTLQWAENDSTPKTISVPVSKTAQYTGNKQFSVALSDPSASAEIAYPDSATVTILGDATVEAGSLEFSSPSYAVAQSAGTLMVTVNRTGGSGGAVRVAYATADGTAASGTDFTAASGVLQWADGDAASKTFTVQISNAAPFSGSKYFSVELSDPSSGASVGTPGSANVTITGDASPPVGSLDFAAASYTVAQNAGSLTVSVNRTGGSSGAVSVAYSTSSGTAVSGTDFTATTGTLQWASGDATPKNFKIAVSNATPFSGNKAFTVALSTPGGGAKISNPGSASVTISGDAAAPVGTVHLSSSSYTVAQDAGTVTVTVDRAGGSSGAVSVVYATSNGSAVAGTDYTAVSGTLTWANGDAAAKTFQVAVSNTKPFSGSKSFSITLSGASGGATLSAPARAGVSISGDAPAALGALQLAASSYTVTQSAGAITVTVNRTGGSAGAVSVAYATSNGTALAGAQYTSASGTLDWADGDASSKSFSISISDATPFSGTKSFSVALSSPSGGSSLSTPSSASVSIAGTGGAGSGGPSAVTNLQLINEGGPNSGNLGGSTLTNHQEISWDAAAPGANPIASYNIYRNGVLYANTTALTYTDEAATNGVVPTWSAPATTYSYAVAAVDTQGNVGPQATQMSLWGYHNGVSLWSDGQLSYGGAVSNFQSTAGNPQGGTYDISTVFADGGGFLPFADAPECPVWDCEIGAFNYFTVDINPGPVVSSYIQLNMFARLPPGDDGAWANGLNVFDYGPAPKANTWGTYKVPLSVLHFGVSHFTGSISGTTLTVTAVPSGGFVDSDGFITGPGIPAGTYVTSYHQAASIGTFTIAGPGINSSTSVPSETMTFQRTNLYKFGLQPETYPVTVYVNNMGFTTN